MNGWYEQLMRKTSAVSAAQIWSRRVLATAAAVVMLPALAVQALKPDLIATLNG
jgi:hypothetical protein